MPQGSYGYDVKGQQVTSTNSATNIWALMLGALQGILSGGGGGGGGNVTIVGATPTGNTTSTASNISPSGAQSVNAGAISVEFILFPSAVGTVNGVTFDNTSANVLGIYRLDAPPWKPLAAVPYVLTAGSGILTVQT